MKGLMEGFTRECDKMKLTYGKVQYGCHVDLPLECSEMNLE